MSRITSIAAALLGLGAGACAMSFDSTHLGVPVTMASAAASPTAGTRFHVNRHPLFIGWGAFAAGAPNLEDVLAGQVANGAGITDLTIRVRARWSDLLVTALTFGFFSPRTVTFEGTVQGPAPATTP